MSKHTIFNLRKSEDVAAKHGFGETQEARFPFADLDAESTGIALIKVKPGQRQPFAHRHDKAEEIYVVLSGAGQIKLDDEVHERGGDGRDQDRAVGDPLARRRRRRDRGARVRPAPRGRRREGPGRLGASSRPD